MASIETLSNSDLRHKLKEYGFSVGPVTETTRKVLIEKLRKLMTKKELPKYVPITNKRRQCSSYFSSDEEESGNEDKRCPVSSLSFRSLRKISSEIKRREELINQKEFNSGSDFFDSPKISRPTGTPEIKPDEFKSSWCRPSFLRQDNSKVRRSPSRPASPKMFEDCSDSDIENHKRKKNKPVSQLSNRHKSGLENSPSSIARIKSRNSKQKNCDNSGKIDNASDISRNKNSSLNSNFVRSPSELPMNVSPAEYLNPTNIFYVKENDNLFSPVNTSQSPMSDNSQKFKMAEFARFDYNVRPVSKILIAMVGLFLLYVAVMYLITGSGSGVRFSSEDTSSKFPICPSGKNSVDSYINSDIICIEKRDIIPAIQMTKILHAELYQRAIAFQCSGTKTSVMTHLEVIKFLVTKYTPVNIPFLEFILHMVKLLVISNPHWGIMIIDTATGSTTNDKVHRNQLLHSGTFVVNDPVLPTFCYLKIKLLELLPLVVIFILALILMFVIMKYVKFYIQQKQQYRIDLHILIKQIINVLIRYQNNSPSGRPVFVPVNHIRDEILKLSNRDQMTILWDQAIKHINKFESRIRCEMKTVKGEKCEVWSWIPSEDTRNLQFDPLLR
ncbi:hypothetical protein L9F63_023110 [Diploptera punctata]|uniref:LEM domain-containing protein n=1 Tax=Diploptera punctata TaxID=6984 RepID=A0AAD7ZJZ1_DIPPU|nr:hypothetical protein L9F63_023110 [Diploptera punctata]